MGHHHNHHHEHYHEHHHEHHHEENEIASLLRRIIFAAVMLVAAVIIEKTMTLPTWQLLLIYLIPYIYIGHGTLREAAEGIAQGEVFNEHFLMTVATIGALAIGFLPGAETEFLEAVFVMLFFQVGELFESYAEGKSRASIAHLMDIRPDVAHVVVEKREEKKEQETVGSENKAESRYSGNREHLTEDRTPESVEVGSLTLVRPGEKIPIDGVVVEGNSSLNTVALTGESIPRSIGAGDEVVSGCINLSGVIVIRTTKSFGNSTVAKIIELVEHAGEHKSQSEAFITRFARVYTPVVVFAAIAIAILPPLFGLLSAHFSTAVLSTSASELFGTWLYRALMFLVVSCPCALVISVPLTFFGGIGGASRRGILVKGANYMDTLAKLGTIVFDKTGTLTHGEFAVEAVHPDLCNEQQLIHLAAHVEHFSTHPIGTALRKAFPDEATDGCTVSDVREVAGKGIIARVDNSSNHTLFHSPNPGQSSILVAVGNTKLMDEVGAKWHDCSHVGTIIHVAIEGHYAGHIVINDHIKEDSAAAIAQLQDLGIEKTVMLTGDRRAVAEHVARQLDISEWHAELLPADKVGITEELMTRKTEGEARSEKRNYLAFVGDGINDAPVLARADVGIAMGGMGSDAAIEAADVVLMDDRPSKIPVAIRIARRTIAIARQNIWFAIGVKVAVLILAIFGLATMWMAVFADVGVTVLAVLNAMRALR